MLEEDRDLEELVAARKGGFLDSCGFSRESEEVKDFVNDPNGEERAIYELIQNICDHMEHHGGVDLIYEDGTREPFTGVQKLCTPTEQAECQTPAESLNPWELDWKEPSAFVDAASKQGFAKIPVNKKIIGIEFVDDGTGINPDNFMSQGSFKDKGKRSLGRYGKGLKIASAYFTCVRGIQLLVESVNQGQEWEGELVEQKSRHQGPVPLVFIKGEWKEAAEGGKKGTRITLRNVDEKLLRALEKVPQLFLYANPYYPHPRVVPTLCPTDIQFEQHPIENGKVECLIGTKKGEGEKLYSVLEGREIEGFPTELFETTYVDGVALKYVYFGGKKSLLPWAIEGLGGEDVPRQRRVNRSHNSIYIDGDAESNIGEAVRNLKQKEFLKFLIMNANRSDCQFVEFPADPLSGSFSNFDDETKRLVCSIFKEEYGEKRISLAAEDEVTGGSGISQIIKKEEETKEGIVIIKNKGLYRFLRDAGIETYVAKVVKTTREKVRSQKVSFASEKNALEKMVEIVARLEDAECELKEYGDKTVMHLSMKGSVESEEILNEYNEDDLPRVLSIIAIVANQKNLPIKILCFKVGKKIEIRPKQIKYDPPFYRISWELSIENTDTVEDLGLEKDKVHVFLEGETINKIYEVNKLKKWVHTPIESTDPRTGIETVMAAFENALSKVKKRLRKTASMSFQFGSKEVPRLEFDEYSFPFCEGEQEDSHDHFVDGFGDGIPNSLNVAERQIGPRLKNNIDLDKSILSPGFYTQKVLPKAALTGDRLVWKNKEFEGEEMSISDEVPRKWTSKVVMRNLKPGYHVLPLRDYDDLLAMQGHEPEHDLFQDQSTGLYYLRVNSPGLKVVTYYMGPSSKTKPHPPIEDDDQVDLLDYSLIEGEWKEIIHRLRGIKTLSKKAIASQKVWGQGFTYTVSRRANDMTVGDTVEVAATKHLLSQRGNCGFAATGAVILDRAIGVPSQYLAGFEVDALGMGDGHAKVRFWDGTGWKIREPQTGCTNYESLSGSSRTELKHKWDVRSNQGEEDKESEELSFFERLSGSRRRMLGVLLASGFIGWSTYELMQTQTPKVFLECMAEAVQLSGTQPNDVERTRKVIQETVEEEVDR